MTVKHRGIIDVIKLIETMVKISMTHLMFVIEKKKNICIKNKKLNTKIFISITLNNIFMCKLTIAIFLANVTNCFFWFMFQCYSHND